MTTSIGTRFEVGNLAEWAGETDGREDGRRLYGRVLEIDLPRQLAKLRLYYPGADGRLIPAPASDRATVPLPKLRPTERAPRDPEPRDLSIEEMFELPPHKLIAEYERRFGKIGRATRSATVADLSGARGGASTDLDFVNAMRMNRGEEPLPRSGRADLSSSGGSRRATEENSEAEIERIYRELCARRGVSLVADFAPLDELSDEAFVRRYEDQRAGKADGARQSRWDARRRAEWLWWSLREHRAGNVIARDQQEELRELGLA